MSIVLNCERNDDSVTKQKSTDDVTASSNHSPNDRFRRNVKHSVANNIQNIVCI